LLRAVIKAARRRARARRLVIGALLIAAVLAGGAAYFFKGGGSNRPSVGPGNHATRGVEAIAKRFVMDVAVWHDARSWKQMHPDHQRLVSHAQYARCESGPLMGTQYVVRGGKVQPVIHVVVDVVRVRKHEIAFREIPQRTAERVSMDIRYATRDWHGGRLSWAVDVVRVNGNWRWLLDQGTIGYVRAHPGACWE
jgi:hypothetical protein